MESIPSSNEKSDNSKNNNNNSSEKDNNKQKVSKTTLAQSQESKFLLDSIQILKNGDDMEIMAKLINLSEYLSLSSDQIADNPNMGPLLEEICKNLEKTYLPELIIYSLQCINYILDINPAFTSTLKKVNAISKIIVLMTIIEDMSCLDYTIKILEKISFENSYALIENNAFISLLNIIDFLGEGQRKSVMKACSNMSMNISSVRVFKSFIQPSLEILASLTKYNDNDIQTTNTAILIFYYIVNNMTVNSCFKSNPEIITEIGKYCFIENCCEILKRFLVENQHEKKIGNDLIKRIFKIFEYLCKISGDFLDKIIANNILNILVDMISNEFNTNNEQSAKSTMSFLTEIFSLLTSFFPSYKKDSSEEIKKEKILTEKNMNNYKFLCQKIIYSLINNIMTKSACSTLSNLVKFLQIFTYSAEKNVIENFMDSKPLSQIISKLLDTKYLPYLSDLIELLNCLMKKCPEHFIVNFLREGIVENLKNFKFEKEEKKQEKADNKNNKENEKTNNLEIKQEDNPNNNNKDNKENKEGINTNKEKMLSIIKKEEENSGDEIIEPEDMEEENQEMKIDNFIISNPAHIIQSGNVEKKDPKDKNEKDNEKEDNKYKDIIIEFEKTKEKIKELNNLLVQEKTKVMKNIFTGNEENEDNGYKKIEEKLLIETKLKDLIDNYFNEDKIQSYLKNQDSKLINIKNDLSKLKDVLMSKKDIEEYDEELEKNLNEVINILTNSSNELTLFELENSKILLALCCFYDKNFMEYYDKIKEDDTDSLIKEVNSSDLFPNPLPINNQIFKKTQILLDILKKDKSKLINYINCLQYTITSMNCFTMLVDDSSVNDLDVYYHHIMKNVKKYELKIVYSGDIYQEKVICDDKLNDNEFKTKLSEYDAAFNANKEIKFLITSHSTFDDIFSILVSHTNVKFSTHEKYDVDLIFYIEVMKNEKKEIIYLKNDMTYKDVKNEVSKVLEQEVSSLLAFPIKFGLSYKLKNKKEEKKEEVVKEKIKSKNNFTLPSKEELFLLNINKKVFEIIYHNSVIYNKNLYEIKRLMPSLYLLTMIYLPLSSFQSLFNIPENLFTQEELISLFINPKVTLLISKASRDGYSVSRSSIPSWCRNLSLDFNYLTKFNSRHLLFKVSFDPKRSLINLQNYLKSNDAYYSNEHQITLEKSMRLKVIVDRDKIIESSYKILDDPITSKFAGFLEFEFNGEIGNGLGPTLEYFSLVIEEFKNDKSLWYKTTDNYFYPKMGINNDKKAIEKFKLLGFIIGRALYDDRLLDIPLSRIFWDVVLFRPISIDNIKIIDNELGKTLLDLNNLVNQKRKFVEEKKKLNINYTDDDLENNILYNDAKLSSLDIYFTFPGNDSIKLKENGDNIKLTILNIEEYIMLIYNCLFIQGIDNLIDSFREGFNIIFDVNSIKCFKSIEIEESICGSLDMKWDRETILENLKAEHGITKSSKILNDLITFMTKLDKNQRRQFLLFTTGTSRLPVGGFKTLNPKFTVVKRTCNSYENPDDFLPTVMTCQNYLKLPEYSNYDVLEKKLILAMTEGNSEFHLS